MDLQEAVRTSLSNLTEALHEAQLAAAVEQGFENYIHSGDVGKCCTICGSSYEKCSKNLSKGPCCGRCGYTDTHQTRKLGTFTPGDDFVSITNAIRSLCEIHFPTTKETLTSALQRFERGTMTGSEFADLVGVYLKENP